MSKKNRFKKKKKNFGRPKIINLNIVVLRDSSNSEKKEEPQKTKHDLEWAKSMVFSKDEHTLQHYKDYEEALRILADAKSPHLFMEL